MIVAALCLQDNATLEQGGHIASVQHVQRGARAAKPAGSYNLGSKHARNHGRGVIGGECRVCMAAVESSGCQPPAKHAALATAGSLQLGASLPPVLWLSSCWTPLLKPRLPMAARSSVFSSSVTFVGTAGSPVAPTSVHGPVTVRLRPPYLATWLIVKPPLRK